MVAALISGGIAAYGASAETGAPGDSMLRSVAGPGFRRFNEDTGRSGMLKLGESLATERRRIPHRYYWSSIDRALNADYCSTHSRTTCTGVIVLLFDTCEFNYCTQQPRGSGGSRSQ
jgi:hypothetical protein